MKTSQALGALVGVGVFVQILLGESGLAAGVLRDVHATIGLAGLAVVLGYAYVGRRSRVALAMASIVVVITIAQVFLGLSLYGLLPLTMSHSALEVSHRFTAYALFAVGIAVSIVAVVLRRRSSAA
ncbi:MAG: hypothetical protein QXO30_07590 [Candidatus Caldarchaeum sp.]